MGLFDSLKDKASELLSGASDKVSEMTGVDLPVDGAADQVTETVDGLGETAQAGADNLGDQAGEVAGVDLPTEGLIDGNRPEGS